MSGYQINEEDIEAAISYLKIHKPEKANKECAVQLLEIMHNTVKKLVSTDIEFAEELEKALLKQEQE